MTYPLIDAKTAMHAKLAIENLIPYCAHCGVAFDYFTDTFKTARFMVMPHMLAPDDQRVLTMLVHETCVQEMEDAFQRIKEQNEASNARNAVTRA